MHVCVNRHDRKSKAEEQDAGGGLGTDPGQTLQPRSGLREGQCAQRIEAQLTEAGFNRAQDALNAGRLDFGQSPAANSARDFSRWRVDDGAPGWEVGAKGGECPFRVQVRGVLRENRGNQLVQRVAGRPPGWTAIPRLHAAFDVWEEFRG